MATSITYGSYSFPDPLPLFSEQDEPVILGGLYDHSAIRVNLIGYLTGASLSALDLQKMQMISGFLSEYQDLTITVENESKVCPKAFIEQLEFQSSDLTTFLPYNISALYYSGESFSDYYKITEPQNSWSYSEGDNKIITATHTVSARGLKVDDGDPFDNARDFVTGKLAGGFEHIGLFNSGDNAFLTSRSENIDRKTDTYGVTEVYMYSASDRPISDSGIVSASTSISYGADGEFSVTVQGTVQGSMDANTGTQEGLLTTGNFTAEQAIDIALNSITNSYSDYESGVYSFITDGPSSFSYELNTGSNTLSFSFAFNDADNLDLINNNVVHKYTTSVNLSKDSSITSVGVNGELLYRGTLAIESTGDFANNARFSAIESAYSQVDPYAIAKTAIEDFTGIATGYNFNSSYINPEPQNFSVTKDPVENKLSYSYSYLNSIDYSTGQLRDFNMTISDDKPLQKVAVQETISGFAASLITSRSLGKYSVAAQCNEQGDKLDTLKSIVSNYCEGSYVISESYSTGESSINYSLSKYYGSLDEEFYILSPDGQDRLLAPIGSDIQFLTDPIEFNRYSVSI
jgi:hypothetical protein